MLKINSGELFKSKLFISTVTQAACLRLCSPHTPPPGRAPDSGRSLWPPETDPAEEEGAISPVKKEQQNNQR